MRNKKLLNIFTILIGALFLFSGIAKGINIAGFGDLLRFYGSKNLYFLAPVISAGEILIGFAMVFLVSPRKFAFLSLILTLLFTLVFAYGYLFLGVQDCGCFGSILKVPPYVSFIRNIIIMVLCFQVVRNYADQATTKWTVVRLSMAVIFSITALIVAIFDLKSISAQSKRFEGKNINETILSHVVKFPQEKKHLLFVFLPTCSHCQKAVPIVKQFKSMGFVEDIVGIYPSNAKSEDLDLFREKFEVDFKVKPCSIDTIRSITKSFPSVFYIKNDTIAYNFIGTIPSTWAKSL